MPKLKAFSFRTRAESSNCRFQGDGELQGSELNLQLNGLETTSCRKNVDKTTQENPDRAFWRLCAHLPTLRKDGLTFRRSRSALHECPRGSVSCIIPFLTHPPFNLPSQQKLAGISVFSRGERNLKILSHPLERSFKKTRCVKNTPKYPLPARQAFAFPPRCFTDVVGRQKFTFQRDSELLPRNKQTRGLQKDFPKYPIPSWVL